MFNEVRSYSKADQLKGKRKAPKRGDRSKFSKMVRDQVKEFFNNQCAECYRRACHVHHVMPRSRGGRNVFTNALLLCNDCHKEVHADNEKLKGWIEEYKGRFGKFFYMDLEDIRQRQLKAEAKEYEKEIRGWKKHNPDSLEY
jgi:HNH endonuclease